MNIVVAIVNKKLSGRARMNFTTKLSHFPPTVRWSDELGRLLC
jgi:hypothetical protein